MSTSAAVMPGAPGRVARAGLLALAAALGIAGCGFRLPCDGLVLCGATCVDVQTNIDHCGACGNGCALQDQCVEGACTRTCRTGEYICAGHCVDMRTDRDHCGDCDRPCGEGLVCEEETCVIACPAGRKRCGDHCIDTSSSLSNCGGCGKRCRDGQTCVDGVCGLVCPGGVPPCRDRCRDYQLAPDACGACGNACGDNTVCSEGRCGPTCTGGTVACSVRGICVDLRVDRLNCGACNNTCPAWEYCREGLCSATCGPDLLACFDRCVDPRTDARHCGGCNKACPPGELCQGGACACAAGLSRCGRACVDLGGDDASCGACGVACRAPQTCRGGRCAAPTSSWLTDGGGARRDGWNGVETARPPLTPAWSLPFNGWEANPVLVDDGLAYVTHLAHAPPTELLALRVKDGSVAWKHTFAPEASQGHPTLAGGQLVVPFDQGLGRRGLLALDARTGAVRWPSFIDSQSFDSWSPAVGGGAVHVYGGYYGGLRAFEAGTGAARYAADLEQSRHVSPTLHGGALYTFVEGKLHAHDPATGAEQWALRVDWQPGFALASWPAIADGRVVLVSQPDLLAFDPAARKVLWKVTGASFGASVAIAGGIVYAIGDGDLHARDAATGAARWTVDPDAALLSFPPVVAAGVVYAASSASTLAFDAATGKLLDRVEAGGWLSVAEGHLFVAGRGGDVAVFRLTP